MTTVPFGHLSKKDLDRQTKVCYTKYMKTLLILALLAGTAQAEWPTDYQHFTEIRELAKGTPKGTHIRVVLNTGDVVFGTLLKYESFDDSIWYQPQGTLSWFKQDAFDVHEISTLQVVEPI